VPNECLIGMRSVDYLAAFRKGSDDKTRPLRH